MADIVGMLDEIQRRAAHDLDLKKKLLATRQAEEPLREFCKVCRSYGYEIYEMDVICANKYGEYRAFTLGELLPFAFTTKDLNAGS